MDFLLVLRVWGWVATCLPGPISINPNSQHVPDLLSETKSNATECRWDIFLGGNCFIFAIFCRREGECQPPSWEYLWEYWVNLRVIFHVDFEPQNKSVLEATLLPHSHFWFLWDDLINYRKWIGCLIKSPHLSNKASERNLMGIIVVCLMLWIFAYIHCVISWRDLSMSESCFSRPKGFLLAFFLLLAYMGYILHLFHGDFITWLRKTGENIGEVLRGIWVLLMASYEQYMPFNIITFEASPPKKSVSDLFVDIPLPCLCLFNSWSTVFSSIISHLNIYIF